MAREHYYTWLTPVPNSNSRLDTLPPSIDGRATFGPYSNLSDCGPLIMTGLRFPPTLFQFFFFCFSGTFISLHISCITASYSLHLSLSLSLALSRFRSPRTFCCSNHSLPQPSSFSALLIVTTLRTACGPDSVLPPFRFLIFGERSPTRLKNPYVRALSRSSLPSPWVIGADLLWQQTLHHTVDRTKRSGT